MSAAASALPSALRSACFAPLSYYERCLDLEYTQLRCFGLILCETLGAYPKAKSSAEIPTSRFAESFGVSDDWVHTALASLELAGLIRVDMVDGDGPRSNRKLYSIRQEYVQEARDAGRAKVKGKCPDCQAVGLFSTEFIPTPHVALRKLGGCVPSAVFRVVMVVSRYTLKWNREQRCIEIQPQVLDLNDFERLTGLDSREITTGLTEAVKLGLIDRELRKGKPSLFSAKPENWAGLPKRGPRLVEQSSGKQKANTSTGRSAETPSNPAKSSANESRPYFYAKCPNCTHFVDVIPVSDEEFTKSQPLEPPGQEKRPPRAGPTRETTSKTDRDEEAWDVLRKWHGPNKTILKA